MSFIKFKAISLPFITLQIALYSFTFTNAITFNIQNNCAYTAWATASPGSGKKLEPKSSWTADVNPGSNNPARIWARTKCTFGRTVKGCETGDCNGVLQCQASGNPPYTAAEVISGGNMDFFDISLLEGFNVPMAISGCNREIKCAADINGPWPQDLKATGGCKNPCTVFNTPKYCTGTQPTEFSKFFKDKCPDAFTYPGNRTKGAFSCPSGTRYKVVFCP